jgi:CelD/BcsL family acetyltransferase involved in cellulose biosynthesis
MIRVVPPGELSSADIDSWRAMQSSNPSFANPFLSPEFAVIVGELRPNTRVAVLSEGSSTVGFFPFERNRSGAGAPIAAGLTDCQGLVHAPGVQWDARELLRACRLSAWQFDHLVAGQHAFERYQTAVSPSPVIDLADGFDSYREMLATRSPQFCRNLERKERKAAREIGHLRFVPDSHDASAFRALLGWKSIQYRRTGQVDIFARPWVADLMRALFSYQGDAFSGLLSVLYADEAPVAAHFGLRGGGILAHWFPAYDVGYSKYSPGLIMHMRMAEFTPGVGVRVIDMGTGINRYKEELKSRDIFVGAGIVTTASPLAAVHRARRVGGRWMVETIKQNPRLFLAAGWIRKRYRSARNDHAGSLAPSSTGSRPAITDTLTPPPGHSAAEPDRRTGRYSQVSH